MPKSPAVSVRHRRELLSVARELAADVGAFVGRRFRSIPTATIRKGVGDFVTETDLAAERKLRRALRARFPDHGFLGEESGFDRVDEDFVWVVDPIDGTSNFAQGLAYYSVSVGCLYRGSPIAAAVHCMPEDRTYSAALGLGATRSGRRFRVPSARLDDSAVVAAQWHRGGKANLGFLPSLVATGARIRVLGCTVAQLCDVAVGRLHANVQEQGRLWDFAAAALIVSEAGGRFTDWSGAPIFPIEDLTADRHYPSLAAGPSVHRKLTRLLS